MFKILRFEITKHSFLKGVNLKFTNANEDVAVNYTTLIIGPNGTGKSQLLQNLIDVLNRLNYYRADLKRKNHVFLIDFELDYLLNDEMYKVIYSNKSLSINGKAISEDLPLPTAWLASSVSINDRFPLLTSRSKFANPHYKYLGIRAASNNSFISRTIQKSVEYFIKSLELERAPIIQKLLQSLKFEPHVTITYKPGKMYRVYKGERPLKMFDSLDEFKMEFTNYIEQHKGTKSYRIDNYKRISNNDEDLKLAFNFLQKKRAEILDQNKRRATIEYAINLSDSEYIQNFLADVKAIRVILDLEIFRLNKFVFKKKASFKLEDASSGESHLITSLFGVIANINNSSLVIIDEPEISLHPNWQLDYMTFLQRISKSFTGVHFVISTHSHFIVSKLEKEESSIVSLRRNNETGLIDFENLNIDTLGWDPEKILYKVFELATVRNKYFELELRRMIELVALQTSDELGLLRLKELTSRIEKFISKEEPEQDPLKPIVDQAKKYLQANGMV